MEAIELMMEEHKNIKRMLKVVRAYSYKVLKGEEVDYNDFYKMIDFIRNYADKHHHCKEEDVLFEIIDRQFNMKNGPIMGMLIEHDQGRLFIRNLENALKELESGNEESKLDIIANAVSYADLLNRHIDKEDSTIYMFANRSLSKENKEELNKISFELEEKSKESGIQNKYLNILEELEKNI
ncbi:hemerythrin domain-containing protein [Clostridium cochlearium]|jgi:hemerythrin-like domain-containing protein|uniref:Hemerythrin domain-containing protein n=1 Tax=Clostridium cochlearium TaxID=1494 RepID=A0A240A9Y5_CLOCO|nr:hemerythrin domain-containing protein [Clostridium cochlearium]MBV1820766.1 hemerythrin domain-containing protein [Bacteroidales bacterium MSK.15.36]MBE6065327.1 hemerythrin domain-containing protein [Clostridium cochlearium]MCG4570702.1 hemerythrin domain-containing protein [Clostridium cochlearium]MCG4579587.1 hemerythrin domain-containing protein [Clostridium cochlearium]MCR1970400.1 hemerythrin domain-containing protein [Clostridium cochlearium]